MTWSGVTVLGENCNVKRRKDKLHSFSRLARVRLYGKNRTKTPRWLADTGKAARAHNRSIRGIVYGSVDCRKPEGLRLRKSAHRQ